MEQQNYYRAREASVYLGVALSTVWLYAKQGKLNPIKLSDRVTIFAKVDLDKFINNAASSQEFGEEVDKRNFVEENITKDNTACINLHSTYPDKQSGDTHEC